jgi:hypothetical protein
MDAEGATATSITVGFTMYRGRQRHPHRLRLLRSNVTGPREFVLCLPRELRDAIWTIIVEEDLAHTSQQQVPTTCTLLLVSRQVRDEVSHAFAEKEPFFKSCPEISRFLSRRIIQYHRDRSARRYLLASLASASRSLLGASALYRTGRCLIINCEIKGGKGGIARS